MWIKFFVEQWNSSTEVGWPGLLAVLKAGRRQAVGDGRLVSQLKVRVRGAGVPRLMAETGTATAEYAIATLAACSFAGVLLALLRSGAAANLLTGVIKRALSIG